MSQENVHIIRRANEALNRGDIVGMAEFFAPNVVYFEREAYLDTPPVVRGREACVEAMSHFIEAFSDFNAELEELIDAGDCVVTVTHWRGSGAGSGASVDLREVIAWRSRKDSRSRVASLRPSKMPSKPWGCRSKTLTPTPEPRQPAGEFDARRG